MHFTSSKMAFLNQIFMVRSLEIRFNKLIVTSVYKQHDLMYNFIARSVFCEHSGNE